MLMRHGILFAILLLCFTSSTWAEEPKKQDTTTTDLEVCRQQVKAIEAVLVGVAQGIQNEMELASFRLDAAKQVKDGYR